LAETLVRRFEAATNGPEAPLQAAASSVYDLLIAPIAPLLRNGEILLFVPESPFDTIPFSLLFDPRRNRYLIEDRPVAIAPSLSVLAELARKTGPQDFSQADFLVVADPAFDRSLNPSLPALPGVQEELSAIQSLYRRAHVVRGKAAGREALLGGMGRYRVLHFGGHALANPGRPLLSSLLLAPVPGIGDTGVLYARDIVGRPDGGTDLVVLSSCRSAGGAAQPGEGVAGLVWSLFSRGVSMVIASTREVEDRGTARLFTSFYRHLAAGEPPVTALRSAQLEMLSTHLPTSRASFDWGAFQIYGAVTTTSALEANQSSGWSSDLQGYTVLASGGAGQGAAAF
jgi:CHAT domain-containing protein